MNEQEKGWSPIRAPILGTFYRRPSPEEPPFVDTGAFVSENDTVCLLEVMKVFNTVKAGVRGYIEKICVESGELVEFGQILFWVRP
jgi:acetyl-CoA carboxylase biotin carboxyl carrier protein